MRLFNALHDKLDAIAEKMAQEAHRREIIEAIEDKERILRNRIVAEANNYLATHEKLKTQESMARAQAAVATQLRIQKETKEQSVFTKNEPIARDKVLENERRERFLLRQRFLFSRRELQAELDQIRVDDEAAHYQKPDFGVTNF